MPHRGHQNRWLNFEALWPTSGSAVDPLYNSILMVAASNTIISGCRKIWPPGSLELQCPRQTEKESLTRVKHSPMGQTLMEALVLSEWKYTLGSEVFHTSFIAGHSYVHTCPLAISPSHITFVPTTWFLLSDHEEAAPTPGQVFLCQVKVRVTKPHYCEQRG